MTARPSCAILFSSLRYATVASMSVLASAGVAQAQFSVIHDFTVGGPLVPNGLLQGSDGNFYGTSQVAGTAGAGTIFKMTPAGAVTVLYNFTGMVDGASPPSVLIQARDGNFYGTARGGSVFGTVFKLTPAGVFSTLHVFNGADGSLNGADGTELNTLVEGTDGSLYGTTILGGSLEWKGVAFKITPTGTFALLHSFTGADGDHPIGGLVQAFDGNFYGTTLLGGPSNRGTVFQMTPTGAVSVLHGFVGGAGDGERPIAALAQGIDGNLYGSTSLGGPSNNGTLFKITPTGTFALLYAFTGGADGSHPNAGLTPASDLRFYGTTRFAGGGVGTIFSMSFSGAVTNVHTFTGVDGANPIASIIHANDGNFYGTTLFGGSADRGVAFRFINPAPCDDALNLSYEAGTLNIGFTLKSTTETNWNTWLATETASAELWSIPIPIVSPAVSLTVPLEGFPSIGKVFVLTTLGSPNPMCADLKVINTGP